MAKQGGVNQLASRFFHKHPPCDSQDTRKNTHSTILSLTVCESQAFMEIAGQVLHSEQNPATKHRLTSAFEALVQEERSVDPDQQDRDFILNLERQIASLRASQESLNRDYRDLQTKKSAMLKEMKGTREQRIKRLEDSKQSFTSWVAAMMQDPERIKRYGIEMEKMRVAMRKEQDRLAELHQYDDGTIDQPFLTPDTVKD